MSKSLVLLLASILPLFTPQNQAREATVRTLIAQVDRDREDFQNATQNEPDVSQSTGIFKAGEIDQVLDRYRNDLRITERHHEMFATYSAKCLSTLSALPELGPYLLRFHEAMPHVEDAAPVESAAGRELVSKLESMQRAYHNRDARTYNSLSDDLPGLYEKTEQASSRTHSAMKDELSIMDDAESFLKGTLTSLEAEDVARARSAELEEQRPHPALAEAATLVSIRPDAGREWEKSWSIAIEQAIVGLAPELLKDPPKDLVSLCPGFKSADQASQLAAWTLVFSEIARAESHFKTGARYHETRVRDKNGRMVEQWSEGLLMLSYGNETAYRGCPIDKAKNNILDADVNLTCGVAIMRNQLEKKRALFPVPQHYYWSTLTNAQASSRIKENLKFSLAQIQACKAN